jgi:hypothetical protein
MVSGINIRPLYSRKIKRPLININGQNISFLSMVSVVPLNYYTIKKKLNAANVKALKAYVTGPRRGPILLLYHNALLFSGLVIYFS